MDLDDENPWEGILPSTMFAIRSTVHTTTQHTPSQLVFGRDALLNINQEANWQLIKQRKQALINKGNQKENRLIQSHVYHTGNKILSKNAWKTKLNQDAYIGPYTVTAVSLAQFPAPFFLSHQQINQNCKKMKFFLSICRVYFPHTEGETKK